MTIQTEQNIHIYNYDIDSIFLNIKQKKSVILNN